jgi:thioredoxin 1
VPPGSKAKFLDLADPILIKRLAEANKLVLIEFWSPWCKPCEDLMRSIEEFVEEYDCGEVLVIRVDASRAHKAVVWFRVLGVPTLLIYRDGKLRARIPKAIPPDQIAEYAGCPGR